MPTSSSFISEDYLLRHYTHEIGHFFKIRFKDYLNQFKRVKQDPMMGPLEKIQQYRAISWKTFQLRFIIHLYLLILSGNRRFVSSYYIHHNVFQLNNFLTPDRREKHLSFLKHHENNIKTLLENIWEQIYSRVNYYIYIHYNGVV